MVLLYQYNYFQNDDDDDTKGRKFLIILKKKLWDCFKLFEQVYKSVIPFRYVAKEISGVRIKHRCKYRRLFLPVLTLKTGQQCIQIPTFKQLLH